MTANGFSSRFFRSRKPLHRIMVAGIHRQVVAADPLDRQDCAVLQQFNGLYDAPHRVRQSVSPDEVEQSHLRAAGVAGDRLGMEAPVERVRGIPRRQSGQSGKPAMVVLGRS